MVYSTTPTVPSFSTFDPFSGSSANTISPNISVACWVIPIVAISNEFTTDEKSLEVEHSDSDYLFNNAKKDPLTKFREIYQSFRKKGRSKEFAFNQTIAIEPFIHNASVYESLKDLILKEDSDEWKIKNHCWKRPWAL